MQSFTLQVVVWHVSAAANTKVQAAKEAPIHSLIQGHCNTRRQLPGSYSIVGSSNLLIDVPPSSLGSAAKTHKAARDVTLQLPN